MKYPKNFLHKHPMMERNLNVPFDHVIVDREDWEIILKDLQGQLSNREFSKRE